MPLRRVSASPAVRRRARDLGIDLSEVGRRGGERIRHGELDAFLTYNSQYRPSGCRRADEQIQVVGLRRRIAENMAASKRSEEHTSELQSLMRISYAVFCLKKKIHNNYKYQTE